MTADTATAGERVGTVPACTARILAAVVDRLAAEGEPLRAAVPIIRRPGIKFDTAPAKTGSDKK